MLSSIFINSIANLDCAVFSFAYGIVGNSWSVDVEVFGKISDNGFIFDFKELKDLVKSVVCDFDHVLILPSDGETVVNLVSDSKKSSLQDWQLRTCDFTWKYECPPDSVLVLDEEEISREAIERHVNERISKKLPSNIVKCVVSVKEEVGGTQDVFFNYTHGLSTYEGLCQRPFHGHRSKIEVWDGTKRRGDLEQLILNSFFSSKIHMASVDQIKFQDHDSVVIEYKGTLGRYVATLPRSRVFIVNAVPTTETFTQAVMDFLKKRGESFTKVTLYEGIGKGSSLRSV